MRKSRIYIRVLCLLQKVKTNVYQKKHDSAKAKKFMRIKLPELTPRHVLPDKKRAFAGPKGPSLGADKDEYFRQFNNKT